MSRRTFDKISSSAFCKSFGYFFNKIPKCSYENFPRGSFVSSKIPGKNYEEINWIKKTIKEKFLLEAKITLANFFEEFK